MTTNTATHDGGRTRIVLLGFEARRGQAGCRVVRGSRIERPRASEFLVSIKHPTRFHASATHLFKMLNC